MAYPYEATHIQDLTPELIRAVIDNPNSTYYDLDALLSSIINSDAPGMGRASAAAEIVMKAMRDWIYRNA